MSQTIVLARGYLSIVTYSLSLTAEYCDSRAVPSVRKSQYLKHLGAELHPNIDIMWTGTVVYIMFDQSSRAFSTPHGCIQLQGERVFPK